MGEKADVVLADYSGMTQDEVNASQQVASGQIVINWEQAYSNDYAAGYVYRQSPVAGRTVREGQSVTLTVSLGIQYVTVPDVSNYVQADGEQQLKDLGVSVLITQAVEPSVAAGPSSAPNLLRAVRWPQVPRWWSMSAARRSTPRPRCLP